MQVRQDEILRYLGTRGRPADKGMAKLIDDCLTEIDGLARAKYCSQIFDLKRDGERLGVKNTTLKLAGRSIARHLQQSQRVLIMAVTLGLEIDKRIAYYAKLDLTRGLVLDACASAAVEALCEQVEEEALALASRQGFRITRRYSPGYGDFPLETQAGIVSVLDTYRRLGLTVTESSLLIPRKSVTALIGFEAK